jgi:hypothetical protein
MMVIHKMFRHTTSETVMMIDRILANLNHSMVGKEQLIKVGVCTTPNMELLDPRNYIQCIRVGDAKPELLQSMKETEKALNYSFENNIHLSLQKKENAIFYTVKTNTAEYSDEISNTIRRMYKTIGMTDSKEIDRIHTFFNSQKIDVVLRGERETIT